MLQPIMMILTLLLGVLEVVLHYLYSLILHLITYFSCQMT